MPIGKPIPPVAPIPPPADRIPPLPPLRSPGTRRGWIEGAARFLRYRTLMARRKRRGLPSASPPPPGIDRLA